MTALPQSYTFRDAKNQTATVRMFISSGADSNANQLTALQLGSDMGALSNAVQESAHGPWTSNPTKVVAGSNAQYADVEDKAVFVFQTATGVIHRYAVPAPKAAIFQADGETIDFTNSLVKQFVADVLDQTFAGTAPNANTTTAVASRNNEIVTVSVGGSRQRKRLQRKFNVFTRNPALTGQGL